MSFGKAVLGIARKLEKTFEKTASNAVDQPDDGSQAFRDSRKAGEDAGRSAIYAANQEAGNNSPVWKSVNLSRKAVEAAPKVEASAKHGWLKFVGTVTAIFTASIVFFSMQSPNISPEQKSALDTIRHAEDTQRQIEALNTIVLKTDDWNIMMGGIEVPMAPTPAPDAAAPEAAAAPIPIEAAPVPIEVAAVAAAPIEVEVETPTTRRAFTTTVGQVYRNSPPSVQSAIAQHAIQHDYNNDTSAAFAQHLHEMSEDWSRRNFPSNNNQPNNIHVDAVDGNGTKFGSADFHQ
jgi:hypothetical protein